MSERIQIALAIEGILGGFEVVDEFRAGETMPFSVV